MARERIDLTGYKYGRLEVIKEVHSKLGKDRWWLCKCDCGNIKEVRMNQLRTKKTTSCGCYQKARVAECNSNDLTGKTAGRLTAIRKSNRSGKHGVLWECQCECGRISYVTVENFNSGRVKSCGCWREESGKNQRDYLEKNYRTEDGVMITGLKRKRNKNNTTGVKGVTVYRPNGVTRYRAIIGLKGKLIYLGTFETIEEAAHARKLAEEKYHKPYLEAKRND